MVFNSTSSPNRGGRVPLHIIGTLYAYQTSQIIVESPTLRIILQTVCLAAKAMGRNFHMLSDDEDYVPLKGRKQQYHYNNHVAICG